VSYQARLNQCVASSELSGLRRNFMSRLGDGSCFVSRTRDLKNVRLRLPTQRAG
jgi:hypothetical protein